jgi:NAD(P)-dependent dehydrogenase (short-subunit alcohol dehydrogenase family)
MRLTGRTAIVTGAASGIERAIAKRSAREGAKVLTADLRESLLEGGRPVHEDIRTAGGEAIFLETDVASASQKPLRETSTGVFLGCEYAVAVLNTLASRLLRFSRDRRPLGIAIGIER